MKYKSLKYRRCYIKNDGTFAVCLLCGSKKIGYTFAATHYHPNVILHKIHLFSRAVINDGTWKEISIAQFNGVSKLHAMEHITSTI